MKRRAFLASATVLASAGLPLRAQTFQPSQDVTPLIEKVTGGAKIERSDVEVELPAIAENGNSVPMRIRVASPMTPADHVVAIHLFAERNPRPVVAVFHLGPYAARADIDTRVRLAGTQKVTVLAELSGKRFRMRQVDVLVTSAACLDEATLAT
jgi:sulfur-oxidizing protein SoxY